ELAKNGVPVALCGIYNSAEIYEEVQSMNVSGCRTLFASTGVKDDSLPAHYYVEKLLAYNSVNTAPIDTIKAFNENGINESALPISTKIIEEHFKRVENLGIDFEEVLDKQIADGLESFKDAFKEILESL
ncbi:MAG: transaldolase, partial [Sulfurimonas sp.]|nr:transaldolase [Sulfurimonas sp.]